MMMITTYVTLKEGAEPEWDATMRERLAAARNQPGWIAGQLLMPLEALNTRIIVGSWETRAAWEAWHNDPTFLETRRRMEGLEATPGQHVWHEVIADVHRTTHPLTAAA